MWNHVAGMRVKLSESLAYLLGRGPDGVPSGDERPSGGTNSIGFCTKVYRNEGSTILIPGGGH